MVICDPSNHVLEVLGLHSFLRCVGGVNPFRYPTRLRKQRAVYMLKAGRLRAGLLVVALTGIWALSSPPKANAAVFGFGFGVGPAYPVYAYPYVYACDPYWNPYCYYGYYGYPYPYYVYAWPYWGWGWWGGWWHYPYYYGRFGYGRFGRGFYPYRFFGGRGYYNAPSFVTGHGFIGNRGFPAGFGRGFSGGFSGGFRGVAEAFAEAVTVNLAEEFAWIELILSNMFQ